MKRTPQNGITLVALVVTIIILLILAGISISALTNQGLFTQAQNAKNLTEEKTAEENEILTNYLEQMNAIIGGQVTESVPDGAIVNPVNDITTWLKTGEISKQYSYTTIEQVIADTTCTESLMNNENAMKYLERSTEFADAICASETTMTYLGQSAYVDDTVLNSDSWKQSIKASEYWSLVYASKVVTVYGAAAETITIDGYYGSFTTGTNGYCSHVVPIDTITLTGSVSGQSFTRTVTSNTTNVYVMPECALYWYGNECGNEWTYTTWNQSSSVTFKKNTNYIQLDALSSTYNSANIAITINNKIDLSKYTKLHVDFLSKDTYYVNHYPSYAAAHIIASVNKPPTSDVVNLNTGTFESDAVRHTVTIDISNVNINGYPYVINRASMSQTVYTALYRMWLE